MKHSLAWLVALGCVGWLASPSWGQEKRVTRTYCVGDLVIPFEGKGGTAEAALLRMLTRSVAPKTWDGAGGLGNANFFPLGLCIVVDQTEDVHAQISAFLETLRVWEDKMRGVKPAAQGAGGPIAMARIQGPTP